MSEDYREAEQTLLFGVLDAIPCPVALLNREGEAAYVNPMGEACEPSLYECDIASLPIVQKCLGGTAAVGGWVTFTTEEGTLTGQAEVYIVRSETVTMGALFLLRPDIPRLGRYDVLPYASKAMEAVWTQLERLSQFGTPVLFLGEPGTGRSSFARALHAIQNTPDTPFVEVDCRTVDEKGAQRLLFGSESRPGVLRSMSSGSLYLKDVHCLPMSAQRHLSEVIRHRTLDEAPVSVRFFASGPPSFEEVLADGRFEQTLHDQLAVMSLNIPPLRERPDDILPLAGWFLARIPKNGDIEGFSDEASHALVRHAWPDNVRELEAVVTEAVGRCAKGFIQPAHLPFFEAEKPRAKESLQDMRLDFNRQRIEAALAVYGHTVEGKRRAAKELGIGLSTLYRLIAREESNP
ncbi:MAG: sigma 54-interacting transcriptional regulator [Oscillospiraceae bacterium]|jgi:DNA-binding NtrC family response regulator|nr:sigma 54-interacting transcriptional regulator [Oscillospiraceae bacterium]